MVLEEKLMTEMRLAAEAWGKQIQQFVDYSMALKIETGSYIFYFMSKESEKKE